MLTTVSHLNDFLYDLTLTDASGQTETLEVSGYHRFYDESLGWVDVENLHNGEILRGDHGELAVTGIVREVGTERVYNMTVEADHVYYVGDLNALVHNACPEGVDPAKLLDAYRKYFEAVDKIKKVLADPTTDFDTWVEGFNLLQELYAAINALPSALS